MICTKCKLDLAESEFFKTSRYFKNPSKNKKRLCTVCKKCTGIRIAENRHKNALKYRELARKWTKNNPDKRKKIRTKWQNSAKGIYQNLKKRSSILIISRSDFIEWFDVQEKKCGYCEVPEKFATSLGNSSMYRRLNIDRKDNNKGYEKGNLLLSCATCNRIKSNIFSYSEMLEIAKKYIKPKWQKLFINF